MFVRHQCPYHATLKRAIHLIIQLVMTRQYLPWFPPLINLLKLKINKDQPHINLKINRGHLLITMYQCTKFDVNQAKDYQNIERSILYMYVKFDP
jgi:hypothetical protein